jgi:hypothetical protein
MVVVDRIVPRLLPLRDFGGAIAAVASVLTLLLARSWPRM